MGGIKDGALYKNNNLTCVDEEIESGKCALSHPCCFENLIPRSLLWKAVDEKKGM